MKSTFCPIEIDERGGCIAIVNVKETSMPGLAPDFPGVLWFRAGTGRRSRYGWRRVSAHDRFLAAAQLRIQTRAWWRSLRGLKAAEMVAKFNLAPLQRKFEENFRKAGGMLDFLRKPVKP